jgi:hypothetical protein
MSSPGFQAKIRANAQKFEFQAEVGVLLWCGRGACEGAHAGVGGRGDGSCCARAGGGGAQKFKLQAGGGHDSSCCPNPG